MNPLSTAYTLAYEYSPIWFTGGSFASVSPVGIPMIALTQALSTVGSGLSALSGSNVDLTGQPFFTWRPLPGSTLWESEVAEFPFFTNQVAANAQVQKPLRISMLGHCPASPNAPFSIKIATLHALQAFIQNHINSGGTFTVFTPSYTYFNCLLTNFIDVSTGETNQAQVSWQMDFVQPLLTFPGTTGLIAGLMGAMSNQGVITPDAAGAVTWSGANVANYYPAAPSAGSW